MESERKANVQRVCSFRVILGILSTTSLLLNVFSYRISSYYSYTMVISEGSQSEASMKNNIPTVKFLNGISYTSKGRQRKASIKNIPTAKFSNGTSSTSKGISHIEYCAKNTTYYAKFSNRTSHIVEGSPAPKFLLEPIDSHK